VLRRERVGAAAITSGDSDDLGVGDVARRFDRSTRCDARRAKDSDSNGSHASGCYAQAAGLEPGAVAPCVHRAGVASKRPPGGA
jgi:hypothetical protein